MNRARIIVTGAAGKTGSVVVTEMLKARYPVRALVHREDAANERLAIDYSIRAPRSTSRMSPQLLCVGACLRV